MIGLFLCLLVSTLQEFMLDPKVVPVGAPDEQYITSAAFDGINRFIVWEDYRSHNNWDIYGQRVTSQGVVLDTNGIPISVISQDQNHPAVAFDGVNFLVVWQDNRNGNYDIYGARVSPSGIVLDSSGIPISTIAGNQTEPSVSFDGTNYLVVWNDSSGSDCDIYGAFVSPAGVVLNSYRISTAVNNQVRPAIAFDGTNYLVVWQDHRNYLDFPEIYCCRVTTNGNILDPTGIPIYYGYAPSIVFGDSLYLISWLLIEGASFTCVARVRPDGTVLDPNGINIFTGDFLLHWPAVSYDNTNFLVISPWQYNGIYAQRVTSEGIVLDPYGIPISEGDYPFVFPSAIFDGNNYFVVWSDWRNGCFPRYSDIYGARITPTMNIIDTEGILVSTYVNMQSLPSVAFDGTNYLSVWSNGYINYGADIYGIRVRPDGTSPDTLSFVITKGPGGMYSQYLATAMFGGDNYLVAWSSENPHGSIALFGSQVSPAGTVINEIIGIATGAGDQYFIYPQIAFDGTNYFVVYEEENSTDTSYIFGAFIDQSGTVIDNIYIWISHNGPPSVAFGTSMYLVVWQEKRYSPNLEICGARVTTTGMVSPLWQPIIAAPGDQELPQITFDGINYFIVWQDNRSGNYDIYGARVTQTGVTLDTNGIVICTAQDDQINPAVIFDGVEYVVVWQDRRNGDNYDIYGARITTAGVVLDPNGVELINQSTDRIYPKISRGPGNQFLLVYQGFVPDEPHNTWRAFGALRGDWGVEEARSERQEARYGLDVYPNPFKNATGIKFQIPGSVALYGRHSRGQVPTLRIYDASGRLVKDFSRLMFNVERSTVLWDGSDDSGRKLPAGVYFVRLESEGFKQVEKVILLR